MVKTAYILAFNWSKQTGDKNSTRPPVIMSEI